MKMLLKHHLGAVQGVPENMALGNRLLTDILERIKGFQWKQICEK